MLIEESVDIANDQTSIELGDGLTNGPDGAGFGALLHHAEQVLRERDTEGVTKQRKEAMSVDVGTCKCWSTII